MTTTPTMTPQHLPNIILLLLRTAGIPPLLLKLKRQNKIIKKENLYICITVSAPNSNTRR